MRKRVSEKDKERKKQLGEKKERVEFDGHFWTYGLRIFSIIFVSACSFHFISEFSLIFCIFYVSKIECFSLWKRGGGSALRENRKTPFFA